MNAMNVLENINKMLEEAEAYKKEHGKYPKWRIRNVYRDLSIFDWFKDCISVSNLKSMKSFIQQGMKRGFNGYVCFKVGAAYCAHGMWIYKNETTNGYSPNGACLYHSFRSWDNYWDLQLEEDAEKEFWLHRTVTHKKYNEITLKDIDELLAKYNSEQ